MQLVLSKNRVIAHGENFLAMGGVVINTKTGKKYENATVAECSGCPSDIDEVGYEYHAGVFVPCAPYGKGNNNGYFMEVCTDCATPRNSGIPIKGGIKLENLNENVRAVNLGGAEYTLIWENASPQSTFAGQNITVPEYPQYCIEFFVSKPSSSYPDVDARIVITIAGTTPPVSNAMTSGRMPCASCGVTYKPSSTTLYCHAYRMAYLNEGKIEFGDCYFEGDETINNSLLVPYKIYGVKI